MYFFLQIGKVFWYTLSVLKETVAYFYEFCHSLLELTVILVLHICYLLCEVSLFWPKNDSG